MKLKKILFFATLAWVFLLMAGGCSSCNESKNDDDDDDNDDTGDDDQTPGDDDSTPDDDDTTADDDIVPPYNTGSCAPCMTAIYETCQLTIELAGESLTQEEAVQSCEDYQYYLRACVIDCFDDNGDACIDLYLCLQGCFPE